MTVRSGMGRMLAWSVLSVALLAIPFTLVSWTSNPNDPEATIGVIETKEHQDAHTEERYQGGNRRQPGRSRTVEVSEGYVFGITVEGQDEPVTYSLDLKEGEPFVVGQRVRVIYIEQGWGPFGSSIDVVGLESLENPTPELTAKAVPSRR